MICSETNLNCSIRISAQGILRDKNLKVSDYWELWLSECSSEANG